MHLVMPPPDTVALTSASLVQLRPGGGAYGAHNSLLGLLMSPGTMPPGGGGKGVIRGVTPFEEPAPVAR